MSLKASFSPGFSRDLKKLKKKHVDLAPCLLHAPKYSCGVISFKLFFIAL